jgi:oligopeptide/dipeptide ABC transporter ATP-binding protein
MLLSVDNLAVSFATEEGRLTAVESVSFAVAKGEILGIVGESGCGKSVTALSIMRLLPQPAGRIDNGRILLDGTDIVSLPAAAMPDLRGRRMSMIFQEPMTALNPVHTIGKQLGEVFRLHQRLTDKRGIRKKSLEILDRVGLPDARRRLKEYPHQISGGMRQRVMIAMALACDPDLLIADEPTTALDVTIQAQILDLILEIQREIGMAVIFITHDMGVIAEVCQRVCVMYAGKIVESARVETLFRNPAHPYTKGLLASIPRLENPRKARLSVIPGMVPTLTGLPEGCRFHNRCDQAQDICRQQEAPVRAVAPKDADHWAACHFVAEAVAGAMGEKHDGG